ncbi:rabBD domain-containing protein [Trichonephila clavipes]|nr:rabBD domain-containing protein [Trichonephila clavipes]
MPPNRGSCDALLIRPRDSLGTTMAETQDKSGGPVPLMQPHLPDLSHLTEEERRIIEGVMFRQQKEEEREQEILR